MRVSEETLQKIWQDCFVENHIHEMMALLEYVYQVDPLKTTIEIGCGLGGSARIWEATLPPDEGMFIGVDIQANIADRFCGKIEQYTSCSPGRVGNWEVEWQNGPITKYKSDRQVYTVVGDTAKPETAEIVKSILQGRLADYFFHDGAHWMQGPCWDYHWFQHLIRTGALVCIADISQLQEDPMSGCQAVYRAFPEPKLPKVIHHGQGMGLWNKQEGFVFDAAEVINRFQVAGTDQELNARRAALQGG